jgi:hypothetical protein
VLHIVPLDEGCVHRVVGDGRVRDVDGGEMGVRKVRGKVESKEGAREKRSPRR